MNKTDWQVANEQARSVNLATVDGVSAEGGGLLSDEQLGALCSWARMMGRVEAPLPIGFRRLADGWLYASAGRHFEMISGPHPGHLLFLRFAMVVQTDCYCICGMQAEKVDYAANHYFFNLDPFHYEMYARLRRTFYQVYGPTDKGLPEWAVEELALTQLAVTQLRLARR